MAGFLGGDAFTFDVKNGEDWHALGFAALRAARACIAEGPAEVLWDDRLNPTVPKAPREYLDLAMGCFTRHGTEFNRLAFEITAEDHSAAEGNLELCGRLVDRVEARAKERFMEKIQSTGLPRH
ncbi:MAG TPA: hypothetical protein VFH51_02145 [Myxococcota bacterium]|nr:hypothetical protein [Myxococcota bacterium]